MQLDTSRNGKTMFMAVNYFNGFRQSCQSWRLFFLQSGLSVGSARGKVAANLHSNGFLVIGARKDVWCFVMLIASM